MIVRQRLVSYGIPTLAIGTVITAALLHRREAPIPSEALVTPNPTNVIPSFSKGPNDHHQIDVVFAVDTTGSMRELIDGAKRTVWSIATHIRKSDPDADLRIGLVAYKDLNEAYVTKPFALTTDLDAVYGELSTYRAEGGGDTPEDVDAALDDALHRMQWRSSAKKLVFLVGDAPPASRGEVPTFDVSAKEAGERGIIINTIRCGGREDTADTFSRIASLAKGEFSSIAQDGGVHQIATPYDEELAEASATVDRTAVIVGDEGARGAYEAKMAVAGAAPAAAKADRATYYAKAKRPAKGGYAARTRDDLVGGVATGTMSVEGVKTEELPADMRGLNKDQLKAEIEKRAAVRAEAQKKIEELSKKRDEYISAHGKDADGGEGGFDTKVKATIEKQLK
jgi:hypothetical protein